MIKKSNDSHRLAFGINMARCAALPRKSVCGAVFLGDNGTLCPSHITFLMGDNGVHEGAHSSPNHIFFCPSTRFCVCNVMGAALNY